MLGVADDQEQPGQAAAEPVTRPWVQPDLAAGPDSQLRPGSAGHL